MNCILCSSRTLRVNPVGFAVRPEAPSRLAGVVGHAAWRVPGPRSKFTKAKVHVKLDEAVPGLGNPGDIVTVKRGYARNTLVPLRMAYYMPRDHYGKPVLPAGWKLGDRIKTVIAAAEEKELSREEHLGPDPKRT